MAPTLESNKKDWSAKEELKPVQTRIDAAIAAGNKPDQGDMDKAYDLLEEKPKEKEDFEDWANKGFEKPKAEGSGSAQGPGSAASGGQGGSTTGGQGN